MPRLTRRRALALGAGLGTLATLPAGAAVPEFERAAAEAAA